MIYERVAHEASNATLLARVGPGLALVLLLAGCLQPQGPPIDASDTPTEYVYSWSTTSAIGLDGGARIEMHPPATHCEIDTAIAGWTSDPGIGGLWLAISPSRAHEAPKWVYASEDNAYVRSGAHDTNAWRESLGAGGVAFEGGGGNLTQGDVVYMLAKNLTSWAAPDGHVFPSIAINARCDAPGLSVMYARETMILHDRNMGGGTVISGGLIEAAAVRDASMERGLNGSVDLFATSASDGQNNIDGTLTIDAPNTQHSWTIAPGTFYQQGPAGHYRAEVDRVAAPLFGCAEPGAPCGTYADWWGFIAGFEETDDPDAFFGLRDP